MSRRKGFTGLTEVAGLTDEQARDLVLGNWVKLNKVLMTNLSVPDIHRLLLLEWWSPEPREPILIRLRRALNRAQGREALAALRVVIANPIAPASAKLLEVALR